MQRTFRCWAEVSLEALRNNLSWLRHHAGRGVRIITVVKADAYGHGLRQTAALLMQGGTDMFGVANLEEARSIRSVGAGWPILMLGACLPHEVKDAVRDAIRPTLSSVAEAEAFSAEAVRQRKTVHAHLKVDTGMGRLGAPGADASKALQAIRPLPGLTIEGICTHFAAAEDDAIFTQQQRTRFKQVLDMAQAAGVTFDWIHASNSAGLLHETTARFNAVRPGLLVYGVLPSGKRRVPATLHRRLTPALTWKCRVALVKAVPKGTPLSYGRAYVTPRKMRLATITAGYGDGYMRSASSRARVLIGGRLCPVVGRVTMDQMLVDASRVPEVQCGDEVVLLGRQGKVVITASQLAGWTGTIPWEVLTNITCRVPRLYREATAA